MALHFSIDGTDTLEKFSEKCSHIGKTVRTYPCDQTLAAV